MTLISKEALVKWNSKNKAYFISRNYVYTKMGNSFLVKIDDLPRYSTANVEVMCDFCGELINKTYNNYLNSKEKTKTEYDCCKLCGQKKANIVKKLPYDEIRLRFDDAGYTLVSGYDEYENNLSKLSYICNIHNECVQETSLVNLHTGSACKFCGIESRKEHFKNNYNDVILVFEKKGYLLISEEYVNAHSTLDYICLKHKEYGIQSTTFVSVHSNNNNCRPCYLENQSEINKGVNNPAWNSELTNEDRIDKKRSYFEYIDFRRNVYERDNYTCQCCGYTGNGIVAHHKDGYHWCKDRRTDVDNGITLCEDCHTEFHSLYGNKYNTEEQFKEWLISKSKESA